MGIARATCQWSLERAVYYIVVVLEHLSYAWLIIAVEMRMTIFNVRLSRDDEAELSAAAKRSGRSKSEIARDASSAHLEKMADDEKRDETLLDDWSEYGSAVINAYDALVSDQISKLDALRKGFQSRMDEVASMEWESAIEPVYKVFRRKVIEKSDAYENPSISNFREDEPVVIGAIGFAADDVYELKKPLEQVFYDYCVSAGWGAFDEIPAIHAHARARLEADDRK